MSPLVLEQLQPLRQRRQIRHLLARPGARRSAASDRRALARFGGPTSSRGCSGQPWRRLGAGAAARRAARERVGRRGRWLGPASIRTRTLHRPRGRSTEASALDGPRHVHRGVDLARDIVGAQLIEADEDAPPLLLALDDRVVPTFAVLVASLSTVCPDLSERHGRAGPGWSARSVRMAARERDGLAAGGRSRPPSSPAVGRGALAAPPLRPSSARTDDDRPGWGSVGIGSGVSLMVQPSTVMVTFMEGWMRHVMSYVPGSSKVTLTLPFCAISSSTIGSSTALDRRCPRSRCGRSCRRSPTGPRCRPRSSAPPGRSSSQSIRTRSAVAVLGFRRLGRRSLRLGRLGRIGGRGGLAGALGCAVGARRRGRA